MPLSPLPPLDPAKSAGLRVDLAICNPTNGKVRLIDGSFVHTSCAVYRDTEFNAVAKRVNLASTITARSALDPQVWDPSPVIAQKARLKVDKYAPLMQIIHKFQRDRSLEGDHSFVPFIVSSLGELSREAFNFREELVSMFKFKVTI